MRKFASLAVGLSPLVLAACAATHPIQPRLASAVTSFDHAPVITVSLSNFAFSPQHLALHSGQPVVLVLDNTAGGGHDFTAPEFFAAAQVAAADAALVAGGQVELQGGQSVTLHLVPAAGEYRLSCTHLGHSVLGMTGSITVS